MIITENNINKSVAPQIETIKLRGGWVKYNGEWCAKFGRKLTKKDDIQEMRPVIGGGQEPQQVTYAILENRAGKETIVELSEYETVFTKYGEAHVYSIRIQF